MVRCLVPSDSVAKGRTWSGCTLGLSKIIGYKLDKITEAAPRGHSNFILFSYVVATIYNSEKDEKQNLLSRCQELYLRKKYFAISWTDQMNTIMSSKSW
jgi:hypothetical protein